MADYLCSGSDVSSCVRDRGWLGSLRRELTPPEVTVDRVAGGLSYLVLKPPSPQYKPRMPMGSGTCGCRAAGMETVLWGTEHVNLRLATAWLFHLRPVTFMSACVGLSVMRIYGVPL